MARRHGVSLSYTDRTCIAPEVDLAVESVRTFGRKAECYEQNGSMRNSGMGCAAG